MMQEGINSKRGMGINDPQAPSTHVSGSVRVEVCTRVYFKLWDNTVTEGILDAKSHWASLFRSLPRLCNEAYVPLAFPTLTLASADRADLTATETFA
jgi:hypothetical protein